MLNQDLENYCNNRENLCDPKCVCRWHNAETQQCICNPQSNSYNPDECELSLINNTVPKPSCYDSKEERDAYCSYPNHKDELECACRGESSNSYECTCTRGLCFRVQIVATSDVQRDALRFTIYFLGQRAIPFVGLLHVETESLTNLRLMSLEIHQILVKALVS